RIESQTREAGTLVEQLIGSQATKPVALPVDRLLFASMKVKRIGEQPARMLLGRASAGVRRYVPGQTRDQRVDFLLPLGKSFGLLPRLRFRSRNFDSPRDLSAPLFLQPVAKAARREAVIPVVARHGREVVVSDKFVIVELQMRLHPEQRAVGV